MSRKTLAVELSRLKVFDRPKSYLEQYPTDSEVASEVLWAAQMNGFIKGQDVVDLGAGTGILGIGCLLLGARSVTFVEKDIAATKVLQDNLDIVNSNYEITAPTSILLQDINQIIALKADLVIQNPPFGTQQKGADTDFIKKASEISDNLITLHKTETAPFIGSLLKSLGYNILEQREFLFPLKSTMEKHKKKVEKINVSSYLAVKKR